MIGLLERYTQTISSIQSVTQRYINRIAANVVMNVLIKENVLFNDALNTDSEINNSMGLP